MRQFLADFSRSFISGLQGERTRVLMGEFTGYIQYPNGRQHNFANLQGHAGFTNESNELLDILQIYDKFPGGALQEHPMTGSNAGGMPAMFCAGAVPTWLCADIHTHPPPSLPRPSRALRQGPEAVFLLGQVLGRSVSPASMMTLSPSYYTSPPLARLPQTSTDTSAFRFPHSFSTAIFPCLVATPHTHTHTPRLQPL